MLVRVPQPQWGLRIIILNKLPVMLVLLNCKPHFEAKPWIAECSGNVFFIIPETTCICNIVGRIYSARPGKALLSAFFLSLSPLKIFWKWKHLHSFPEVKVKVLVAESGLSDSLRPLGW